MDGIGVRQWRKAVDAGKDDAVRTFLQEIPGPGLVVAGTPLQQRAAAGFHRRKGKQCGHGRCTLRRRLVTDPELRKSTDGILGIIAIVVWNDADILVGTMKDKDPAGIVDQGTVLLRGNRTAVLRYTGL